MYPKWGCVCVCLCVWWGCVCVFVSLCVMRVCVWWGCVCIIRMCVVGDMLHALCRFPNASFERHNFQLQEVFVFKITTIFFSFLTPFWLLFLYVIYCWIYVVDAGTFEVNLSCYLSFFFPTLFIFPLCTFYFCITFV